MDERMKTTKKQVEKQFKELYPEYKEWDHVKQTLVWNTYTDDLNRDGEITDSQRNNWLYPRDFKKYK
jgi:hypothetical protein